MRRNHCSPCSPCEEEPICTKLVIQYNGVGTNTATGAYGTGDAATNFGPATMTYVETNGPPGAIGFKYFGTQRLTFADGSTLDSQWVEGYFANSGPFMQKQIITGGTGRFAGATGTSYQAGSVIPTDDPPPFGGFTFQAYEQGEIRTPNPITPD